MKKETLKNKLFEDEEESPGFRLVEAILDNRPEEVAKILADNEIPPFTVVFNLKQASSLGHTGCVKELISYADPKIDNSHSLGQAAVNGHLDCLRLLATFSNPKAKSSKALFFAAAKGHFECTEFLYHLSDVKKVKASLVKGSFSGGVKILESIEQRLKLQNKANDMCKHNRQSI